MSKVTMESIAIELGISKNTVSRALRGLSGVSEDVRQKIVTLAEDSGYKIKSETGTLYHIVMVHRKVLAEDLTFWPVVLSGIMTFAADKGISIRVITIDSENGNGNNSQLQSIKSQKCDGLLVVSDIDDKSLHTLTEFNLPMVVVDYHSDIFDCDYVVTANRKGIFKALSHLVENNHTKIGFVGNKADRYSYRERYHAYRYYMQEFGLLVDDRNVWLDVGYHEYDFYKRKIDELGNKELNHNCNLATAYLCVNDAMAVDFAIALGEYGYHVPDDISIVGFDNIGYPGGRLFTTLDVKKQAMGKRAVEQLLAKISNPEKTFETISINTELITRDTVKKL